MSGTGWFFTLGIIYLVLLFTLAVLSFRKGHWVLGLIGFIFPLLWVIGAILPGRRAAADEGSRVADGTSSGTGGVLRIDRIHHQRVTVVTREGGLSCNRTKLVRTCLQALPRLPDGR